MMRLGILLSLGFAIVAVSAFWFVFGGTEKLAGRFDVDDCRKVSLRIVESGRLVEGAADMAISPDGQSLIVAAIDRSDEFRPYGGLFAVSLFDLAEGSDEVEATEYVKNYILERGVRPQGIAFQPGGERLALINRVGPEHTTVIDVLELQTDTYRPVQRYEHEAFCRAHDLTFDLGGNLLITRDRAQCKLVVNDMMPWSATGILLSISPEGELSASSDRYLYPTGIAMGPSGEPIIAEMRAGRLKGGFVDTFLPGGPEMITVDDQGALVVALHPNLWQLMMYVNGFAFSSPSRIVRLDPEQSDFEVLFDDPSGGIISAASVGVHHDGALYMGSPIDEGITMCQKAAGA